MVEYLKVLSLSVEPAYASSPLPMVEYLKVLISRAPKGPLPYGRACLRILNSRVTNVPGHGGS
jgi:hypothetical protein